MLFEEILIKQLKNQEVAIEYLRLAKENPGLNFKYLLGAIEDILKAYCEKETKWYSNFF